MLKTTQLHERRQMRLRSQLAKIRNARPRLSVFRSSKHIHAQLINARQRHTLAAASTLDQDLRASLQTGADVAAAQRLEARPVGTERVSTCRPRWAPSD